MESKTPKPLTYVLITPARDEARFIRKTLDSVVSQTVKPLKWVIVSDGSTDGTDEIVKEYAAQHDWIELLRMPERKERHFGGKVHAFNAGWERVKHLPYDIIGNQDGDSSYDPDYIEYLLGKFAANPRLGVAGTNYVEEDWDTSLKHDYRFSNINDVTGQCQLFRRECFDAFGGYKPSRNGGVDLVATIAARMHGWETRVFTGKILFHHRQQGTAQFNKYTVEFSNGRKDYMFGSHPAWEICRSAYRLTKKPVILGGALLFAGYFWAMLRRIPRVVSPELMEFRRNEQMQRLGRIFHGLIVPNSTGDQRLDSFFRRLLRRISPNYFTIPYFIPRICREVKNWPRYFAAYFLRLKGSEEFQLRNGIRLSDGSGALAGTMAVVFIRREYGTFRNCRTIVDVGSHVGCFALYAAHLCPEARIYCYEPELGNFNQLTRNVRANGLDGRISTFNNAVTGECGQKNLSVGGSLLNSFHIIPHSARQQTVQCTTLRDILDANQLEVVDLLKMNCEGAEYDIFEGCSQSDFERIANVRLEYHNVDGPGQDGESLARLLEERGFRIERFSTYRNASGFIWATRSVAAKPARSKGLAKLVNLMGQKAVGGALPHALAVFVWRLLGMDE